MTHKRSENHQNILNKIREDYYNQSVCFFQMAQDPTHPIFEHIGDSLKHTDSALQLYEDMNNNLEASRLLVASLPANHPLRNESILWHIKVIIFTAKLLGVYGKPVESFKAYDMAVKLLVKHKETLDYKNDVLFQQEVEGVFNVFNYIELRENRNNKDGRGIYIKNIKRNIGNVSTTHAQKCGSSFVTTGNLYDTLLDMLASVERGIRTKEIEKQSAAFFNMAKKLTQQYEEMKKSGELSTEQQVYYIELNDYLMNVTELMKKDAIILVKKTKPSGGIFYEAHYEQMSDSTIDAYLDGWDALKKSFIEPTFLLMKTLNMKQVNTNIYIGMIYGTSLEHWLTLLSRTYVLFGEFKKSWIETLEIERQEDVPQNIKNILFRLENEIDYIADKSRLIIRLASLCNSCTLSDVLKNNGDIIEEVNSSTTQLNQLREALIAEDEKKLKEINENANALTQKEDEEKAEREKKSRQRYLYFKEKKLARENNHNKNEETHSKKVLAKSVAFPVNKTLEDLEAIDEASIHLARSLNHKTTVSLEWLVDQAEENVSIPSDVQKDMFVNMNATLIDYYHLVTLQEKHIALSQLDKIKRDEKLKIGILVSHIELKNTLPIIYGNIQSLLGLIDKIIVRQKRKKENKLYKWGLEKAKVLKKKNLSYAEIIKLGKLKFKEIGINKQLNNQDVSEYTKEKKFLDLMQLHFTGFLHLQKQIGPSLFDNYHEMQIQYSSFNPNLPDSCERFEGFLGLILKQQYDKYREIDYLTEAFKHTSCSFEKYRIENIHTPALCEMARRLAIIEEEMAEVNSQSPDLLKQALGHYQDALLYNLESENAKMDLSDIEEVNQRISSIQKSLGELNKSCRGPY